MAKHKQVGCKDSVESAIDNGISELEALQEEMDSWASGMEDTNLANSDKCQAVREAADTLESSATDARRAFEEIQEEIQELYEGKPEKPGCETHILDKKCKRCGWDGKIPEIFKPVLTIYDPPQKDTKTYISHDGKSDKKTKVLVFAEVQESDNCCQIFRDDYHETQEEAVEKAKKLFDEKLKRYELSQQIPKEKPAIPAVEPVFDEDIPSPLEGEVSWVESRPYGRHVSRASRLGTACQGISAGVDGLRAWLESLPEPEPDYAENISGHLDELQNALEECESVEFPGMFG